MSRLVTEAITAARRAGHAQLDEPTAKAILSEHGLAVPRGVTLPADAVELSPIDELNPPLVLKIRSADIQHKSDGKFVVLGITDREQLDAEITAMRVRAEAAGAAVDGYLVEETAPAGVELVVGGLTDPTFGPVLMVGLGGVLVEVLGDVAFRLCPIDRADAEEMIEELAGKALLDGPRGRPAVDRDALIALLLAIGGPDGLMIQLAGQVSEIDLNPVIARGETAVAVDALMLLTPGNAT